MRAASILALCIGVLVSAQSFVHAAPNSAVVASHASSAFVQPNFVSGARWGRQAMSLLRPRPAVTRLHILGGTRGLASSAMAGSVPGMLGFADAASPSPPVQAPDATEPKGVTGAVVAHYDDLHGRMMSAPFGPADHSKAPALRVLDMGALQAAGKAGARARAELCDQLRERHFAVSAVSPPDMETPERPLSPRCLRGTSVGAGSIARRARGCSIERRSHAPRRRWCGWEPPKARRSPPSGTWRGGFLPSTLRARRPRPGRSGGCSRRSASSAGRRGAAPPSRPAHRAPSAPRPVPPCCAGTQQGGAWALWLAASRRGPLFVKSPPPRAGDARRQ